jgi:hypothetical protein
MGSSRNTGSHGSVSGGDEIFGLALIAGGIYLGYLFVTNVLPVATLQAAQLAVGAMAVPGLPDEVAWSNIGWDALVGLAAGLVIGCLRYVLRIRSRWAEDVVDAMATRDGLSVSKAALGLLWVLWHGLAGAVAGVLLGWLGMIQFPQFSTGHAAVLPTLPGSAIKLLTANGFFPFGGPPPPDGNPFLALIVIVVIAFVAIVILTLVLTAVLVAFGGALASGFAGGFCKSIGINIVLALTRPYDSAVRFRRRRRGTPVLPPLDLEQQATEYTERVQLFRTKTYRPEKLANLLEWLRRREIPSTPECAVDAFADYSRALKREGMRASKDVLDFLEYLRAKKAQDAPAFSRQDLREACADFLDKASSPPRPQSERVVTGYLAWLAGQSESPDVEAAIAHTSRYPEPLDWFDQRVLSDFIDRLRWEKRRREPPAEGEAPPEPLFPRWSLRFMLGQALWLGCITAVLNVVSSAVCLLIAVGKLRHLI